MSCHLQSPAPSNCKRAQAAAGRIAARFFTSFTKYVQLDAKTVKRWTTRGYSGGGGTEPSANVVMISAPLSVIATVCSNCADSLMRRRVTRAENTAGVRHARVIGRHNAPAVLPDIAVRRACAEHTSHVT